MKKYKLLFILLALIVIGTAGWLIFGPKKNIEEVVIEDNKKETNTTFDYNILKEANKTNKKKNYLISPYSMKHALLMLKEGASGETRKEIEKVLGNKELPSLNSKNRISTANSVFINEKYRNDILDSFNNSIKTKYNGEVLYDAFKSPKIINDWISEKTYGMINDPIGDIDESFALGIVNAVAIDVEWVKKFECYSTTKQKFTNGDEKYDAEMMHNQYSYNAKYFKTKNEEGIILPYRQYDDKGKESDKGIQLEFIGIIPQKDISTYIDQFTKDTINTIDKKAKEATENTRINLSLPSFEYDYDYIAFSEALNNLGIKKAFNKEAEFENISTSIDLKVEKAIHKTYIKLGESGTKAAAVTAFMMSTTAYEPEEYKTVDITFDKPFMYIIRDSKTKENLFIGTVYKPNIWKGETCQEKTH